MITSTLAQLHWYKIISPNFDKAITYALTTDLAGIETGKYPVDGENVLAIVNEYTTKPVSECDPESHRDYADIQIMVAGAERFGDGPAVYRVDGRTLAPVDQPQHQRQNDANQQARHQRKIEDRMFASDDDVAGQPP